MKRCASNATNNCFSSVFSHGDNSSGLSQGCCRRRPRRVTSASSRSRPPSSRLLASSVLFLLCTALFWNSLGCEFVFDDVTAIKDNRDLVSY